MTRTRARALIPLPTSYLPAGSRLSAPAPSLSGAPRVSAIPELRTRSMPDPKFLQGSRCLREPATAVILEGLGDCRDVSLRFLGHNMWGTARRV